MNPRHDRRSFLAVTGGALTSFAASLAFGAAPIHDVRGVVIGYPHDKEPGSTAIKCRLGAGAQRVSLQHLGINVFDPNYGGRWNAGSNSRGGGTPLSTAQWVAELGRGVRRVGG